MVFIHHFIVFTWGCEIYDFFEGLDDKIVEAIQNLGNDLDITKEKVENELRKIEEAIKVAAEWTK